MKLKSILSTGLFVTISALSIGVQAASDIDKATEAKAPTTDMQADRTAKKKMKPHSHVQEKTGVPQTAPEANLDKPNPAMDMSKHYHPRDGK